MRDEFAQRLWANLQHRRESAALYTSAVVPPAIDNDLRLTEYFCFSIRALHRMFDDRFVAADFKAGNRILARNTSRRRLAAIQSLSGFLHRHVWRIHLSHLLLVSGLLLGFKALENEENGQRYAGWSVLILLSIYLSRPDLILLVLPFCIVVLWKCHRSVEATTITIACAIAPTAIWTIFSLVYYGTAFPNTAYAKLGTGISTAEYIRQGVVYLEHSMSWIRLL